MIRIAFIERKYWGFVSIEKIFAQLAKNLRSEGLATCFRKLDFHNSFSGIVRNLLTFRRPDADIFHITGHVHYMALVLPPERTVLTVHDLGFLHIRSGFRRWLIKKLFLDWPLRRNCYVTAISQRTKEEILEYADVPETRIIVIENPLQEQYLSPTETVFRADEPTILQVGTLPNKNLPNVAKALSGIPCRLRIVGSLTEEQKDILADCRVNYTNDPELDDEGMRRAYEDADIVMFCSTFEGFGMPLIEGQSMRRAVVTSRIRPLTDVGGDGAFYADPTNVEEIRAAVLDAIGKDSLRNEIIEKGARNAERFAPELIARRYAALYREILEKLQ